jgi:hypothetical protein
MTPAPPAPPTQRGKLLPGEGLLPGSGITSLDGRFSLILQTDGNLVLNAPRVGPIWSSNTSNHPDVFDLIMQTDGNLVIYNNDSQPFFSSNTEGVANATLVVQNDGNVVIYSGDQAQWSTNTQVPDTPAVPAHTNVLNPGEGLSVGDSLVSASGNFRLTLQADGNLVEYSQSNPVFATNTTGLNSWCLIMQGDGNLVLYDVHRTALWASNTGGNAGVGMIIQDDGNMVIYAIGTTQAIFATGQK